MKWEEKELKNYVNVLSGYAFKSKLFNKQEKGLPLIRVRDVGKSDPKTFYSGEYPKKYIIEKGDLLIAMDGEFRVSKWESSSALLNQRVCKISVNKDISIEYFKYFLAKVLKKIEDKTSFVTVKHLSVKKINSITIPLPPLPIQHQIADLLDTADALCRTTAEQLQQLDDLAESVFLEMFGDVAKNEKGWKIDLLGNNFSTKKAGTKCGPFGSALKKHEYIEKGVPVWVMDNIKKDKFSPNRCLFITSDKYETLKSYSVEKGDIIISRAGTVGKMCVIDTDIPTSIIHSNIIRLSLNENKILPIYFTLLMKYAKGRVGKLKKGDEGAYSFMNTGILKKLKIPIPPLKKQTEFAKIIENIEVQKAELKQSLQDSEDLFKGLLQEIFN